MAGQTDSMTPVSKKVLIMEEKQSGEYLHGFLKTAGYSAIYSTKISREAVSICQRIPIDLVLIDVAMSNGEGFSTIVKI